MPFSRVENPQFFDYQNYLKYKDNIWDSSYKEGLYFSAMEELGQELLVNIGLKKKGDTETNWFQTPHALHDGQSALKVLAKEQSFTIDLPKFEFRPNKSLFRSISKAAKSTPKETHQFKNQSEKTNSMDFQYIRLNLPESTQKYSDTALFSKVVCQTLMKVLTKNKSSRWMIPVRLRDSEGLQASYLGLEVKEEDSVEDFHKRLVQKLKMQEHWGFYFISKLGLLLGKKVILFLTKKNVLKDKTIWMGALSNLGDLGSSKELEELTILGPVRWHRPVGAVIYKHNGAQVLTIAFHNSLKKVDADEITRTITELHRLYC